jgi:hypothetical protein
MPPRTIVLVDLRREVAVLEKEEPAEGSKVTGAEVEELNWGASAILY